MRTCIIGGSGKLAEFAGRIDVVPGATDDREVIERAVAGSEGLPVWSRHVGDPILESNLTRRVDFALFMVEALENVDLIHEAPAIVSRQSASALAHAA